MLTQVLAQWSCSGFNGGDGGTLLTVDAIMRVYWKQEGTYIYVIILLDRLLSPAFSDLFTTCAVFSQYKTSNHVYFQNLKAPVKVASKSERFYSEGREPMYSLKRIELAMVAAGLIKRYGKAFGRYFRYCNRHPCSIERICAGSQLFGSRNRGLPVFPELPDNPPLLQTALGHTIRPLERGGVVLVWYKAVDGPSRWIADKGSCVRWINCGCCRRCARYACATIT
jgi:hypothetical protein